MIDPTNEGLAERQAAKAKELNFTSMKMRRCASTLTEDTAARYVPVIGVLDTDKGIALTKWPNGGWTVSSNGWRAGAYTSAEEMLAALSHALIGPSDQNQKGEQG